MQRNVFTLSLAGCALLVLGLPAGDNRLPILLFLGILLGATLFLTSFGFASAYRNMLTGRDFNSVRAQVLLLAVSTLMFSPVLSAGQFFGQPVTGASAPVALQVAAGALLFGIGMQLAGGCASGTLYATGSGSLRMLCTLAFFCAGSFMASLHFDWWQGLPSWGEIVLAEKLGWPAAVVLQLAVLGLLWKILGRQQARIEKTAFSTHPLQNRILLHGACVLAALSFFVLITAGHPWSITWGFTLWAAKMAMHLGWDPQNSNFWNADFQREALSGNPLNDVTSVMDIGLLAGALAASSLVGEFRPRWPARWAELAAAILGGIAMGYGARIGFGCNIGAFYSGVASTSLHGWLWIAAALPGCWIGVRLRPLFGIKI
ncbi:MAG: YeeE/YedE family protein [Burkholderiales bacterium]